MGAFTYLFLVRKILLYVRVESREAQDLFNSQAFVSWSPAVFAVITEKH
jgi:hypothetical protein